MPDALRLTLGGAPQTWHAVTGLPGLYHPTIPSPVGGPGEATPEQAKNASKDAGAPVELVKITDKDAARAREHVAEQIAAARNELRGAEHAGVSPWLVDATRDAAGDTNETEQPAKPGDQAAEPAAGDTP